MKFKFAKVHKINNLSVVKCDVVTDDKKYFTGAIILAPSVCFPKSHLMPKFCFFTNSKKEFAELKSLIPGTMLNVSFVCKLQRKKTKAQSAHPCFFYLNEFSLSTNLN